MGITITIGDVVKNKTFKYIYPILETYSKEFNKHLNSVKGSILATAIWDIKYEEAKREKHTYLIFIVFDTNGNYDNIKKMYCNINYGKNIFSQFLKFIRRYTNYVDDYPFDSIKGHQHCVILKISDKFKNAFDLIKKSEYSKAYSSQDLKEMNIKARTPSGKLNLRFAVLTKSKKYKEEIFVNHLNDLFGTNIKALDISDEAELDFPFNLEEEIFNYK